MISPEKIIKTLKLNKINFFTGVPDSTLKELIYSIEKNKHNKHMPATNEGSAVSLGIGYQLATKKIPAIYLQNSGLSNALNPLISIAHKKVYSIPLLLFIGWRGAPDEFDEPQHLVQGKITLNILKLLNIKYCILKSNNDIKGLKKIISFSKKNSVPVACLIKRNTLINEKETNVECEKKFKLKRSDVLRFVLKKIQKGTKIISTTGYTSRELHQIKKNEKVKRGKDFYMVGGMGHASMVALGVSLLKKNKVLCIDGDGSLLMHLGSLNTIGFFAGKNFKHVLLNNQSHESVGGQKTLLDKVNFKYLSMGLGYKKYFKCLTYKDLYSVFPFFLRSKGPSFLEICISKGTLKNLSRPRDLLSIKKDFIK
jgi:phosphonopyruvate decarboxylase